MKSPLEFQKPNPNDFMAIEDIIIKNSNTKNVYASHPKMMNQIFTSSYCDLMQKKKPTGPISHNYDPMKKEDIWTAECGESKTSMTFHSNYLDQTESIQKIGNFAEENILLARRYYQKQDYEKAKEYFFKTIEWEPASPEARLGLFILFFKDKECKSSERNYKIIKELNLSYPREGEILTEFQKNCKSILQLESQV
jgi:tetratricopeptide (TPR) repeat protein